MKYSDIWFGDHLGSMSFDQFSKEVDSTFSGHPNKGEKIAELYALFQISKPGALNVGNYTASFDAVKQTSDNGDDYKPA